MKERNITSMEGKEERTVKAMPVTVGMESCIQIIRM